ncbi:hypothetical protein J1N35_028287 [Gossypium stocksii]|uniref:PGG domain-containing protein n=1 Tax=Gossypium stocksii TaxID=47602 RepID=A0A9D3UVS9_9ROSI|nr:hypothetical protein J1N35_028287 [Gossypium stocksii]
MHSEGLNSAINSTTVVDVLVATVAFAGIFQVPSQYVNRKENSAAGLSLGEARIGQNHCFIIFIIFDAISLFTSLVVAVVQTSFLVIQSNAKEAIDGCY